MQRLYFVLFSFALNIFTMKVLYDVAGLSLFFTSFLILCLRCVCLSSPSQVVGNHSVTCFRKHRYTRRIHEMETVFHQYKRLHNRVTMSKEVERLDNNFCNRKFIFIGNINTESFGNRVIEQIYGLIFGVILNRSHVYYLLL